jgi:hypothetical protein
VGEVLLAAADEVGHRIAAVEGVVEPVHVAGLVRGGGADVEHVSVLVDVGEGEGDDPDLGRAVGRERGDTERAGHEAELGRGAGDHDLDVGVAAGRLGRHHLDAVRAVGRLHAGHDLVPRRVGPGERAQGARAPPGWSTGWPPALLPSVPTAQPPAHRLRYSTSGPSRVAPARRRVDHHVVERPGLGLRRVARLGRGPTGRAGSPERDQRGEGVAAAHAASG